MEFGGEFALALWIETRVANFDDQLLAIDPAQIAQTRAHCLQSQQRDGIGCVGWGQPADPHHLAGGLRG
jgi:hypothetical protein